MNDRFKFRVWNKARQCFISEKEIFICGNGELVLIDEALNRTWVNDNPNYKVSFCTGLKDKNGKLIYEGDIVEREHIQGKKRGVVEFNENLLEFRATNMSLFSLVNRSVVIGNIYENEDLLKCENQ